MFVCCECCVLSGRGLCDGLITRPKESHRPVAYRGGVWGVQTPSEIPKTLQNRAKTQPDLRKLLKIAKFRTPTPQDVRKKGSKILKLPRFAIVLH